MPRFQAGFSDADAAGAVEKAVGVWECRIKQQATRRDFISTISANLVALFKGSVTIRPEFFINGVYGKGPIEFGILYDSDIIIGVTTAKRGDMDQGLAQNLIQLYSTAQTNQSLHGVKKRKADDRGVEKILYGLVTDAEYWCITRLVFTDEETQVSLSDQNAELFCPLFLSDKSALHSGLTELYKQVCWLLRNR
ncbi:hypothetical protein HK098_002298 [Nowakowskiella sp. JEL0407]|nr:hypothetical protein HK098_002298 [Nowakowskiella sp. JEL0407]